MEMKKCDNPSCDRLVPINVQYCCTPCVWSARGGYLMFNKGPLGHTDKCNARHVQDNLQAETPKQSGMRANNREF